MHPVAEHMCLGSGALGAFVALELARTPQASGVSAWSRSGLKPQIFHGDQEQSLPPNLHFCALKGGEMQPLTGSDSPLWIWALLPPPAFSAIWSALPHKGLLGAREVHLVFCGNGLLPSGTHEQTLNWFGSFGQEPRAYRALFHVGCQTLAGEEPPRHRWNGGRTVEWGPLWGSPRAAPPATLHVQWVHSEDILAQEAKKFFTNLALLLRVQDRDLPNKSLLDPAFQPILHEMAKAFAPVFHLSTAELVGGAWATAQETQSNLNSLSRAWQLHRLDNPLYFLETGLAALSHLAPSPLLRLLSATRVACLMRK